MPEYLDTWSRPGSRQRTVGTLPAPSFKQQAMTFAQILGLVSGLDATKLALYPDVSHWNGKINLRLMKPYVHALMAKCSDGKQMIAGSVTDLNTYVDDTFSDNVQQGYDEGLPVIAYPYFQPEHKPTASKDNDRQYQALLYALRNKKPGVSFHEIRIDVEERAPVYHTTYRDRLQTFYAWCLEDFGSQIPISFYTSVGFMNAYPAVRDWLALPSAPKIIHYAQWVHAASSTTPRISTTWEKLKTEIIPKLDFRVLNYAGWEAVQWTNLYYGMAGTTGEMDLNFDHEGPEAFWKRLNFKQTTPPSDPGTPTDPGTDSKLAEMQQTIDQLVAWKNKVQEK